MGKDYYDGDVYEEARRLASTSKAIEDSFDDDKQRRGKWTYKSWYRKPENSVKKETT